MDRDLIKELARQEHFSRIACYRLAGQDATLILDTGDDTEDSWPAIISCSDYYYTLKNKPQLTFGWQVTPPLVIKLHTSLRNTKSYLPPQDPWSAKLLFIIKKDGRSTGDLGELDGFLEALGRRFHFWVASDELRHFIDDTTAHEQIHAFGVLLSRMIGHEMRNPVTNLLSLAQTHALIWQESGNDGVQFAKEVEHYSQNIWDVIQKLEILVANGNESFTSAEPAKSLDFQSIVRTEAERERNRQDSTTSGKLLVNISDGNYDVLGIPSLINLAVREVLHNAFTYAAGTTVTVSLYTGGGNIVLDISDEGAAIAPGQEELIFMRYFQGPRASGQKSSVRSGLGLGLYLARFVSIYHNAQLLFVRGVGKKGAFRFIWPQNQSKLKAS